eukprot:scaffold209678_cov37-Prasinocladus_malaysianus.AAC.1
MNAVISVANMNNTTALRKLTRNACMPASDAAASAYSSAVKLWRNKTTSLFLGRETESKYGMKTPSSTPIVHIGVCERSSTIIMSLTDIMVQIAASHRNTRFINTWPKHH